VARGGDGGVAFEVAVDGVAPLAARVHAPKVGGVAAGGAVGRISALVAVVEAALAGEPHVVGEVSQWANIVA
jgi:hypothetical protein